MYIQKWAVLVLCLMVLTVALCMSSINSGGNTAHAQDEVVLYNSRYIFVGDVDKPAIFDTATGVFRVWDTYPDKVVRSYSFESHKDVSVDIIYYK